MPGSPDWQQITEWFGAIQDQGTGVAIGAGSIVLGPYDLSTYSSVIVSVKPTGGTITGTITQTIPGGPAALTDVTTFTVANGAVGFEAVVLLAGRVTVTLQGSAGGETVTYAVVPANTNVNANVTSGGTVTNITPTPLASWPPSAPVDGDVQILELPTTYDPVGGKKLRYLCTYNSADAMWNVSGPPLYAEVQTQETITAAAYGNLATVGPSITLPRNCDGIVSQGALMTAHAVAAGVAKMAYDGAGITAADADAAESDSGNTGASVSFSVSRTREKASLTTASALTAKYKGDGVAASAFEKRWLQVELVRIA